MKAARSLIKQVAQMRLGGLFDRRSQRCGRLYEQSPYTVYLPMLQFARGRFTSFFARVPVVPHNQPAHASVRQAPERMLLQLDLLLVVHGGGIRAIWLESVRRAMP